MDEVAKIAAGRQDGGVCDIPGERCHHPISCSGGGCVKRHPQPNRCSMTDTQNPHPLGLTPEEVALSYSTADGPPMAAIEVTQADRDAAREWIEGVCHKYLANEQEQKMLAQLFARHRIASETALRERVAVLEQAAEPFALYFKDHVPDDTVFQAVAWTVGQHRALRAAIDAAHTQEQQP